MAKPRNIQIESPNLSENANTVSTYGVLCVFISLVTILADLTTVILVFAEYCSSHYYYWAAATTIFILVPNVLINTFSLRWHLLDSNLKIRHWITHIIFIGLIERYVTFLHKAFWCKTFSEKSKSSVRQAQQNDLNLLHYLYTFTGTVPQMLLQIYAIITLEDNYQQTKILSVYASSASVIWACMTYVYSLTVADSDHVQWPSIFLQSLWHLCMLVARLAAILLFTVLFGVWTLVPMGLHWAAMTFWIVTQKTTFCPNKFEETLYNVVMGFVYCFSYINLREGHTRYRLMMFYTMIITQNFASLLLYILISNVESQRSMWSITSTVCVVAGTIIGICSMLLYYRWFHAKGPIIWKNTDNDIELNNKVPSTRGNTIKNTGLNHVRSFKSLQKDKQITRNETAFTDVLPQVEIETTDKKVLLDHWIARSGTPTFVSAPIGNDSIDSSRIEIYTVENTPQSINIRPPQRLPTINESLPKKVAICSPTEQNLKLSLDNIESSIDEITLSNLNSKRRAICSSDELRANKLCLNDTNLNIEEFKNKNDQCSEISHETNSSNKKTSSDSIDMDLDLSFSDINSSDINTFNENIVQKLCLSALKNIKVGNQDADIENIQKIALGILKGMKKGNNKNVNAELLSTPKRDIETPTEMSVHDYENICAVNIAREAWGLRSWNVYSDIENWLHDGSVFRERLRDNLTSESSEISSCLSNELKNSILSTPSILSTKRVPTYSNIMMKFDNNNHNDYVNTMISPTTSEETYTAKPFLIDNKDISQLEPILEELDNLGDIDSPINKKRLNSEISLVATIDEIRKAMIANSPRNVHCRREYTWDSPELSTSEKLESNLKRALWKEPSKFNSSNIMEALPEKQDNFNVTRASKLNKKELNVAISHTVLEDDRNTSLENKAEKRKQKSNNIQAHVKKLNNRTCDKSITNNDIDYLWNLVSINSVSSVSVEDLSHTPHFTSSLQSLILKDNVVSPSPRNKSFNVKRGNNNRPRRKFSILRERFEPRPYKKSGEEILYQYDNVNARLEPSTSASIVNVKNKFDTDLAQELSIENREEMAKRSMGVSKSIKDKRSQFMKQVLSPPKFNAKLKHKF